MAAAYTGWKDARNDRVKAITFGDDSPLPTDVIAECGKVLEEECVAILWHQGLFGFRPGTRFQTPEAAIGAWAVTSELLARASDCSLPLPAYTWVSAVTVSSELGKISYMQ
ncbi:hypothetical protein PR202_gb20661 [Eleusine coracana subsp. coracana]|uniref:Uncharacterized protein n=1 Tax=Eleusine coracana subsp. coracana TaxID=191504 RepID=A0AAV5FB07_ELECO|nr:hypothetical protein PR202_gb20661 [Eleusine coracana subsp. coracana]